MSVYGCPDQELNEWKHGYFNITVSSFTQYDLLGKNNRDKIFKWRYRDLLLLGPYGKHFFQLNFCTKDGYFCDPRVDEICPDDAKLYQTEEWPSGEYIIFGPNTGIENYPTLRPCPIGKLN